MTPYLGKSQYCPSIKAWLISKKEYSSRLTKNYSLGDRGNLLAKKD
jgi:hypothetical protein